MAAAVEFSEPTPEPGALVRSEIFEQPAALWRLLADRPGDREPRRELAGG